MAAADLLERNPNPSEEEIRARPRGQPLPLHRLPQHRPGGAQAAAPESGCASMTTYVGRADEAKEDPRLSPGRPLRGRPHTPRDGHAAIVRSPRRTPRSPRSTRRPPRSAPGVMASSPATTSASAAAPDGLGPAGRGDQRARPHAAEARRGQVRGRPRRRGRLPTDSYGAVDAAEDVIVEYDAEAGRGRSGGRRSRRARRSSGISSGRTRPTSGPSRRRRHRRGAAEAGRRRRAHGCANHRTAGAPIEPRGCVAEPRGENAHPALVDPDPPHHSLAAVRRARHARAPAARGRARRGRRLRRQAAASTARRRSCSRSRAVSRPVKWIESRSENMATSHHGRDQIADITIGAKSDGTVTGVKVADRRRPRRLLPAAERR